MITFRYSLLCAALIGHALLASSAAAAEGSVLPLKAPPVVGAGSAGPAASDTGSSANTSVDLAPGAVSSLETMYPAFNSSETSPPQQVSGTIPQPTAQIELGTAPQLAPGPETIVQARSVTSSVRMAPSIRDLRARVAESAYPETVRRQGEGYISVNIPPGWKLVPLRSLKYNPAPSVQLANGEVFAVESAPFVLVPANDVNRVPINPRSLQVLHNFTLASEELMRQLMEALSNSKSVTRIE